MTNETAGISRDIGSLREAAGKFQLEVDRTKREIGPVDFEWYPHGTLSAFAHLDRLLTGGNRLLFDGKKRILDVGCQDGELAFFLERLGHEVTALDHPTYSHNGMRGAKTLKAALGSAVQLADIDIDRQFVLPYGHFDIAVVLGVLYHLRNPFYALDELARRASYCLLSTRVARRFPNGEAMPRDVSLAYLLGERELNCDETNYFIFSETGLRTLLNRTYWNVQDWTTNRSKPDSDPVRPDRDERVFCLARSRYDRLANVELVEGWHAPEETGWRWTRRCFSARIAWNLPFPARTLLVDLFVSEGILAMASPLELSVRANGIPLAPELYSSIGEAKLIRALPGDIGNNIEFEFQLNGAISPDPADDRERGLIVNSIRVE